MLRNAQSFAYLSWRLCFIFSGLYFYLFMLTSKNTDNRIRPKLSRVLGNDRGIGIPLYCPRTSDMRRKKEI